MHSIKQHIYFMNVALQTAKMSTCKKLHVGAVVAKDGRILGTGYNGNARGELHCTDCGCRVIDGHCTSVHSEENAIINCAYNGLSTKGATIYCTHIPCDRCSRRLVNAGIVNVIYLFEYRSDDKSFNSDLINFIEINSLTDYFIYYEDSTGQGETINEYLSRDKE